MASTGKCSFCGAVVTSDQKQCPECGAKNEHYTEDSPRRIMNPRTIEELKEYCAERGMPLLRMRFFIGEDFREPKAFGIYRDGDRFIVYKNKADGSRAVRYSGPDEAYAVNELYQKLLTECRIRGIYPDGKPAALRSRSSGRQTEVRAASTSGRPRFRNAPAPRKPTWKSLLVCAAIVVLAMLALVLAVRSKHSHDGYYRTGNGTLYYSYGGDWYYQTADDWARTYGVSDAIYDYYEGDYFDSGWGGESFRSSDMWEEINRDSDSDSSGSWDSYDSYDSWDSSDTDWDSDW